MIFADLANRPDVYAFYGVFQNYFKLGSVVFQAIEDEDDGYRSYLDTIAISSDVAPINFSKKPVAYVTIQSTAALSTDSNSEGFELYSPETKHTWLEVGTANTDDYYPYFVFYYTPDTRQTTLPTTNLCPLQLYPELFL